MAKSDENREQIETKREKRKSENVIWKEKKIIKLANVEWCLCVCVCARTQ